MAWSSVRSAPFGPEPTRWEYRLRGGHPHARRRPTGVANELADVSFPGIAIVSIVTAVTEVRGHLEHR